MPTFSSFTKVFTGDLVIPGYIDYEASIARLASNATRKVKVVAFVKSSDDVAPALKAFAFARVSKLPIAIRGGGHTTSGASSSEGGLVIDLSRHLNTVDVDAQLKTAWVGGGSLWHDVDTAMIAHGLAGVAGTVNRISVGGCVLAFIRVFTDFLLASPSSGSELSRSQALYSKYTHIYNIPCAEPVRRPR